MIVNPTANKITVQPQFDAPERAMQRVQSALGEDQYVERTKNMAAHGADPEAYLLLWEERFKRQEQSMRKLWEMYTTVHRRFRGVTISDQFGYFGTRPETQGRWIEYDPEQDGEVHPINIVRPDLRANVSALLQVEVGVQITAPNQDARFLEIAERLQLLADFFQRDTWTEAERALLFDGIQKEGTLLIETLRDADSYRSERVSLPTRGQQHYASFQCANGDCGIGGTKQISAEEAQSAPGEMTCPGCNMPSPVTIQTLDSIDTADAQVTTSEIGHKIWSGYNFLIDRVGARRKGIQSAKYLRTMELVERAELEDTYPQHQFSAPFEWSYGLKCQQALASADWSMLYSSWQPTQGQTEWDLFQKNTNFLHESAYKNYIAPTDWEFRDRDGKLKFKIERGQSFKEAVKQSMGEDVCGFRVVMVNEQIIDIETPPDHEPDFRKVFADIHFQRDSGSYHSTPHWDSVTLQDDITLFNTIKVETAARNAIEPVWFNSEIFDEADFGKDHIASKDGALDKDADIAKSVYKPPTAKAADSINEHLQFLLGIRREVSGVQPALLGESQPGQPYAAQRQQLDQAFGLLTTAAKSNAQMVVETTKQAIQMAFRHWSLEQFQSVSSRFGETWDEQDVQALIATDLNRDVEIDYVNGTDQPQGSLAKELKFFQGLKEVMPFVQAGVISGPIMQQILKRVDEFSGFDFDLSGAETSDALAQKRYRALSDACAEFKPLTRADIEEYKAKVVAYEPDEAALAAQQSAISGQQSAEEPAAEGSAAMMQQPDQTLGAYGNPPMKPITAWDMLQEEIVAQTDLYISPTEDMAPQVTFFTQQISIEMAKPQPNYALVDMMEWLVGQFTAAIPPATNPESDAKLVESMGYKDVPDDIKRQMEAKAGFTPSVMPTADPNTAKVESENARTEADIEKLKIGHEHEIDKTVIGEASKENDRDFEREKMAHELTMHEGDQAHEAVQADADRASKEKQSASKPAPAKKPPAKK